MKDLHALVLETAGFSGRFAAKFTDNMIVTQTAYFLFYFGYITTDNVALLMTVLSILLSVLYFICFHTIWGQTCGRIFFGIKLISLNGEDVSAKQAWLRYSIDMVIALVLCVLWANMPAGLLRNPNAAQQYLPSSVLLWFAGLFLIWGIWDFLNFIVFLTNPERRTIRDFIAGTRVIKLAGKADYLKWKIFIFLILSCITGGGIKVIEKTQGVRFFSLFFFGLLTSSIFFAVLILYVKKAWREQHGFINQPAPARTLTSSQVTAKSHVQSYNTAATLEPSIYEAMQEEDFWAQALGEFEGKNRKPGLWAKFYSESEGNESQAKAKYLKLRVEQLAQEYQENLLQTHRLKQEAEKQGGIALQKQQADQLALTQKLQQSNFESERQAKKLAEIVSQKQSSSQGSYKLGLWVFSALIIIFIIWAVNFSSDKKQQQSSVNTLAAAPASIAEPAPEPATAPASVSSSAPATEPKYAPEFVEWLKKNTWYGNDQEKTAIAEEIVKTNPGQPLVKLLELVDNRIAELYGTKKADTGLSYGDSRFVGVKEGIIKDTVTGLMWEQNQTSSKMKWQAGMSYAETLRLGGNSDWRLPTQEELEGLIEYAKSRGVDKDFNQFYNQRGFKGWMEPSYWSSTTNAYNPVNAVSVDFYSGFVGGSPKTLNNYVRAVRSGQ